MIENNEYSLIELKEMGSEMYDLIKKLFPICRSITGDGVRETLNIIKETLEMPPPPPQKIRGEEYNSKFPKEIIPSLQIVEIPSGTEVFDWKIPKEWNIADAYIKNSKGEKIVDFKKSNLHVLNYSIPVHRTVSLTELKKHLFTLPQHPEWIPYHTSYYKENWGFCISHNHYENLLEDDYEVVIDSSLKDGNLTYAELIIRGESEDEVLISSYFCHPSMCNDNLSGISLATKLAECLQRKNLRYTYRFLFIPETIGAIAWLSSNEKVTQNIKHGLQVTCVGDKGISTYKRSRQQNSIIDKAAEKVLRDSKEPYTIVDFFPDGSDERQFCSPGFNLPVGSLMRTMYGKFPEYHTSADDLSFVHPEALSNSLRKYLDIIYILENNKTYVSLQQKGEPQLGKRGLYSLIGAGKGDSFTNLAEIQWVLNMSDGFNSLLDIAIRSQINFRRIKKAADALLSKDLLKLFKSNCLGEEQ